MIDISFKLDPEIIIGMDTINRTGTICNTYGGRTLIVAEQVLYENRNIERLTAILNDFDVDAIIFDEIPAQAAADIAESAAELARGARCSAIIGFGGIITQSIARMAAIIANSGLPVFELLDGTKPEGTFLPYIAIPTTGRDPFLFSNYLLAIDPRDRSIKQVKSPEGLCKAAVIDGNLSESLSGKFAATMTFDGFCVAVEAYCSNKSQFLSDALLEQAIAQYAQIMNSYKDIQTFDLTGGTTNAGFLTALGSAMSCPGIGTALAYAINGRFSVAKSWCSTVLLPYVLEKLAAARPEKIAKVAALMGESVDGISTAESAELAVEAVRRHMGVLKVPARLKEFDLSLDRLVPVAETAHNLEFVAYSPWTIAAEDAFDLLKQAF